MDARIVTDAQRGDERAFALIVEAVSGRFLGTAHRILHDAQLAEDATQHAFLRMWRHLPGLRDAGRFEAWAYRLLGSPATPRPSAIAAGARTPASV